jgi:hypothetical protein
VIYVYSKLCKVCEKTYFSNYISREAFENVSENPNISLVVDEVEPGVVVAKAQIRSVCSDECYDKRVYKDF